ACDRAQCVAEEFGDPGEYAADRSRRAQLREERSGDAASALVREIGEKVHDADQDDESKDCGLAWLGHSDHPLSVSCSPPAPKCNHSGAANAKCADISVFACGIRFALADVVLLASVPRSVLILLSLSTCAVRVHSQSADMPGAVAEVSGCLRIVSIAASRRSRS